MSAASSRLRTSGWLDDSHPDVQSSGKTLLLKALMGLMPYSGRIARPDTRLGFVPQDAYADPSMPLRVRELLQATVQRLTQADIDAALVLLLGHR